jgi:hypothetical protein
MSSGPLGFGPAMMRSGRLVCRHVLSPGCGFIHALMVGPRHPGGPGMVRGLPGRLNRQRLFGTQGRVIIGRERDRDFMLSGREFMEAELGGGRRNHRPIINAIMDVALTSPRHFVDSGRINEGEPGNTHLNRGRSLPSFG